MNRRSSNSFESVYLMYSTIYICRADMNPMAAIFAIGSDKSVPQLPDKFSTEAKEFVNCCLIRYNA